MRDIQPSVLSLPVELHFSIFNNLGIEDILALRKTCSHFFKLTQDSGFWSTMFTQLSAKQALPCSQTEFAAMSPSHAARVLLSASKVEASFLSRREHIAYQIADIERVLPSNPNAAVGSWRVLAFLSAGRFLLAANDSMVIIWDVSALMSSSSAPVDASTSWAYFPLPNLLGYVDCRSTLWLSFLVHKNVVINSISFPSLGERVSGDGQLRLEAQFPLLEEEQIKHMDPLSGRALLYCPQTSIHILHWRDGNRRTAISIPVDDDADQGWNAITSLRFCGPYVLCFRLRSVEACPVPTSNSLTENSLPVLPMLRHRFGPVCFRAFSLSDVHVSRCLSGEVYTVFVLGNDVHKGLFHYQIQLSTVPVPSLTVHVLAKGTIVDAPLLILGTDFSNTIEDVTRRMFVATWSVGSAGLRGVWVDRFRGSINRRVVAFTTHLHRLRARGRGLERATSGGYNDTDALAASEESDEEFMGGKVYQVSSLELRDDITICAVSEWTGRIALGSRGGVITIL